MKEHLLEVMQIPIRVCNSPKKLATKDKIKPLGFQRVGSESGQPRLTRLRYFIMPFGTGNYQSQHVLLHLEEYGDHLVENERQM
jgi:hypothetical protein